MWTTLSSRVERFTIAVIVATIPCAGAKGVSPEAPRDAPESAVLRPLAQQLPLLPARLEIESAVVHRAAQVPELVDLAGRPSTPIEGFVVIEVRTEQPLGDVARSALPVIILNGTPLVEARAVDQQRLVALVPAAKVRERNTVAATCLGAEQTRSSSKPIVVRGP